MDDTNHDDGLVHSHGWACGERGQPKHETPAEQAQAAKKQAE